jgi:hypothetical protein
VSLGYVAFGAMSAVAGCWPAEIKQNYSSKINATKLNKQHTSDDLKPHRLNDNIFPTRIHRDAHLSKKII